MLEKIRTQESSIDLHRRARTTAIGGVRAGFRSVSPCKPPSGRTGTLENGRAKSFIQTKLREKKLEKAK